MAEPSLSDVAPILENARTIAVLGVSANPAKPAHYVPAYLAGQGYTILPVNPARVGQELFGRPVLAGLSDLDGTAVDILDVFRRPGALPDHLPEILAMEPRPKVVWFQQGIQNDAVAAELRAAGIVVVQDRCTLADHRRLKG